MKKSKIVPKQTHESDRIVNYQNFKEMDQSPEISVALNILSSKCISKNKRGDVMKISSNNPKVKKALKRIFHNTLNINSNLEFLTRDLLKYGDLFLKLEIDKKSGIHDVIMLPVDELHREDTSNGQIGVSRFKWDAANLYFEEWQGAHFRLFMDSEKLPFGTSVLKSSIKSWKELQITENSKNFSDVTHYQNKILSSLKVLKQNEQSDIRLSRYINRLQQFIIVELRRIANIHLYFLGFDNELNNFELTLVESNK